MSKAIKYKVEIIDRNTSYVKALSELHAICFRGKGKEYWNDQSFRVLLGAKGTIGFSATADDCSLLGFVIGRSVMDESEVLTLCVLPTARRNGGAKNLMLKLFGITQTVLMILKKKLQKKLNLFMLKIQVATALKLKTWEK